ncbi:MAG: hypothetical protein AAGD10_02960 [Myxococcota bacterium]
MKKLLRVSSVILAGLMALSTVAEARPLDRAERREARRERQNEDAIRRAERARRGPPVRQVERRRGVVFRNPGVRVRVGRGRALTTRRIFVRSRVQDLRWDLERVDRNGNGIVTRRELRRAARRGIVLPFAVEKRVLRNGRASVRSLVNVHRSQLQARFARLDLNRDGVLSPWELRRA